MNSDVERLLEVVALLGQRLNGAFKGVIPEEAQAHLLNAQRELLTALILIYEHQVGTRRSQARPPIARPQRSRPRKARLERIQIE